MWHAAFRVFRVFRGYKILLRQYRAAITPNQCQHSVEIDRRYEIILTQLIAARDVGGTSTQSGCTAGKRWPIEDSDVEASEQCKLQLANLCFATQPLQAVPPCVARRRYSRTHLEAVQRKLSGEYVKSGDG